jgi:ABC-type polysaccharide/polyol phosphate transport system ATPase subunit
MERNGSLLAVTARSSTSAPPAVVVEHASKTFRIPHERAHTLKERVLHPRRRSTVEELRAVDDVSFEVAQGEFFGIVGRNGSGKSTLLKCLAGIYRLDGGSMAAAGRISPFIELGVGFNPDLSARDNVVINAIMLGLTPREAERRFDEIIAFAELEEFVDLKLKNYSSGMHVRLAFAVMVQVEAEVLLIDEVLAVGDAAFQQKCFDEFRRMRAEGRTILFVTHSMADVQRFCDRAMLLERGKLVSVGPAVDVATMYNEINFGRGTTAAEEDQAQEGDRPGDRSMEVVDAWFEDASGERVAALPQGEECRVVVEMRANEAVEDPVVALEIINEDALRIFATNTNWLNRPTGRFQPGERAVFTATFRMSFTQGRYHPLVALLRPGGGNEIIDRSAGFGSLMVSGVRVGGGLVDLPHDVAFERGAERIEAPAR